MRCQDAIKEVQLIIPNLLDLKDSPAIVFFAEIITCDS